MAEQEITRLGLERYHSTAKALIFDCQALADGMRHVQVTPLHLMAECLTADAAIAEAFARAGASVAELQGAVEGALARQPVAGERAYLSMLLLDLLSRAERDAQRRSDGLVGVEHLLNALCQEVRGAVGEILGAFRLGPGCLQPHLSSLKMTGVIAEAPVHSVVVPAVSAGHSVDTPGHKAQAAQPHGGGLSPYVVPLTEASWAVSSTPLIGRAVELRRLQVVLQRRAKNHPLLVGNVGVGKGAIVAGLSRLALKSPWHVSGAPITLHALDVARLVSGVRIRTELDARVEQVFRAFATAPGAVLVIRQFEQLYHPGSMLQGVGELLRSAMERGGLRLLCSTTPDGEKRLEERDPLLYAQMTRLFVPEPTEEQAVEIVAGVADLFAQHHRVSIDERAARAAVQLAHRYLPERSLPDSALDLLDEAAAGLHSAHQPEPESSQPRLTEHALAETLAQWTGVPTTQILEAEADKLRQMEDRLSRRVVGQKDALSKIARAIRRSRVGLRNPRRPIGSFLFVGPSGVGKTELARALAQFLFDDEQALMRLDMSEYMERHMAQRLLGAPPGYADSERGGLLTEAVRARPYSVLLFDEVEKAHQDVFNLLLQVLDNGRLTDGRGRVADFSHTVVILTSNLVAYREDSEDGMRRELGKFFRPEFLNRIDEIVPFAPLSKEDLLTIVDIGLAGIIPTLQSRGLSLAVTKEAKVKLVDRAYDPDLGARPLERALVRWVQDPIAEGLVRGEFESGQQLTVHALESPAGRLPASPVQLRVT